MSLIVMKFGGTSVADPDKIQAAAARAVAEEKAGNQVIVVVSAMGKTTDNLIAMAHDIHDSPPAREMDMLMTTGEQVTIALMAIAIESMGVDAISFTGGQVGIYTDSVFRKARIRNINDERLREALDEGKIVVVAGFQGISDDNEITTLGRGGSDTTAVALAAALQADRCDIYTDVDGIYTADPRIVKSARKLDRITFDEILELASVGAQVLYHRRESSTAMSDPPLRGLDRLLRYVRRNRHEPECAPRPAGFHVPQRRRGHQFQCDSLPLDGGAVLRLLRPHPEREVHWTG